MSSRLHSEIKPTRIVITSRANASERPVLLCESDVTNDERLCYDIILNVKRTWIRFDYNYGSNAGSNDL